MPLNLRQLGRRHCDRAKGHVDDVAHHITAIEELYKDNPDENIKRIIEAIKVYAVGLADAIDILRNDVIG